MAMTDDVLYDVEDAWLDSPEKIEYEKLIELNKIDEAYKLKRETTIALTKAIIPDYLSEYEKRLDTFVMNKIDISMSHMTDWKISDSEKVEFTKNYKHEFYQYIMDRD